MVSKIKVKCCSTVCLSCFCICDREPFARRLTTLHPASTTHQQLSNKELEKAGVPAGLIRLSIGLEDVDDLIDDLKVALSWV